LGRADGASLESPSSLRRIRLRPVICKNLSGQRPKFLSFGGFEIQRRIGLRPVICKNLSGQRPKLLSFGGFEIQRRIGLRPVSGLFHTRGESALLFRRYI